MSHWLPVHFLCHTGLLCGFRVPLVSCARSVSHWFPMHVLCHTGFLCGFCVTLVSCARSVSHLYPVHVLCPTDFVSVCTWWSCFCVKCRKCESANSDVHLLPQVTKLLSRLRFELRQCLSPAGPAATVFLIAFEKHNDENMRNYTFVVMGMNLRLPQKGRPECQQ